MRGPMELDAITAETLQQIIKAQTTGITTSTGLVGFDLRKPARSLVPVETPWRNLLSRELADQGSVAATWRVMLNVNNQQPSAATAFDFAGAEVLFSEQDVLAKYQVLALSGLVTRDAIRRARNYDDARGRAALGVLQQVMISEDRLLMGAQNFALQTPATPTMTTADTGGSIAATTTVPVKVRARTGANWFYGGGTVLSTAGSIATSSAAPATHSVTASVPAVAGAVAYDWFVSDGTTFWYYTTTTVASVKVTSVPTATALVPATLPLIANAGLAGPTAASAAVDTSAVAAQFNGFLASVTGDYDPVLGQVTRGTGIAAGATFVDNGGATLTNNSGQIPELDNLLLQLYQNARLGPTALMMNAQHALDISTKVVSSNAAVTFLGPTDEAQRANIVAGGYVGRYLNKAMGGVPVRIEVHPALPPGTIVARSDSVPYPNSNIGAVCSVALQEDYVDIPYAANRIANTAGGGPREEFEVRAMETFRNEAPAAHAVLSNVANG
jgi:hypothetical protein